jgi:hypothetical protein
MVWWERLRAENSVVKREVRSAELRKGTPILKLEGNSNQTQTKTNINTKYTCKQGNIMTDEGGRAAIAACF